MSPVQELVFNLTRPPRLLLVARAEDVSLSVESAQLRYDCVTDVCGTVSDVEDRLLEHRYSVVFVDVDSIGLDVARMIKQGCPPPVVLLVGQTELSQAALADWGLIGLLAKPVTTEGLEEVFRTYRVRVRENADGGYFREITDAPICKVYQTELDSLAATGSGHLHR